MMVPRPLPPVPRYSARERELLGLHPELQSLASRATQLRAQVEQQRAAMLGAEAARASSSSVAAAAAELRSEMRAVRLAQDDAGERLRRLRDARKPDGELRAPRPRPPPPRPPPPADAVVALGRTRARIDAALAASRARPRASRLRGLLAAALADAPAAPAAAAPAAPAAAFAPAAVLGALRRHRPAGGAEEVCAICLAGIEATGPPAVALPCGGAATHAFHEDCVARLLRAAAAARARPTCPTCRRGIIVAT